MSPKRYKLEDIKRIPIVDYLASHGVEIKGGRCSAFWRDGDNEQAVSIDKRKNVWHDFPRGEGGSVIDLCMKAEGLSFRDAVVKLGEDYNIEPTFGDFLPRPRTPRRNKPNWAVVAWCIVNADNRDELFAETKLLTDEDRLWTRRVATLLKGEMRGRSLDDVLKVAIREFHAQEPQVAGRKEAL